MNNNSKVTFEVMETIGVVSKKESGWTKELNIISWNGGEPKYDIRDWSPDHTKMGRGVTLTEEEGYRLAVLLQKRIFMNEPAGYDCPGQ